MNHTLNTSAIWPGLVSGLLLAAFSSFAFAESDSKQINKRFEDEVRPFLANYCLGCHGKDKQEAKLDLSGFGTLDIVVKNQKVWEEVLLRLKTKQMPPDSAPSIPQESERLKVVTWIQEMRDEDAKRNEGDPGQVLARRLSSAEFDYSIRDLTGVDIRPTKEFPVDPANEAGFDNSGETLCMSPALAKKYLAATRKVAEHLVLKPRGFEFAPHVVVTDTDRDKHCVQRIVEYYKRQPTDIADYLLAAWKYERRDKLSAPEAGLDEIAHPRGLSAKYVKLVWEVLSDKESGSGPLGEVQDAWKKFPSDGSRDTAARRQCEQLRDLILKRRKELSPKVDKLQVNGISPGSQPLVLWKNRELAAQRIKFFPKADENAIDESTRKSLETFCRVFPDAFYIADRPPYFEASSAPSGRLLTAGFHLMQGYFRDDEQLGTEALASQGGVRQNGASDSRLSLSEGRL